MTKPAHKPAAPLPTRHVFLETEVYRRAGFNLANTQFSLLAKRVTEGKVALHVTDITLAEIKRQLQELAREKATMAKRLARDFDRLAQIGGGEQSIVSPIDGDRLADTVWSDFVETLSSRFNQNTVRALETPSRMVFERYFAGRPPFDQKGSKEFPDAFVVEGLAAFCGAHKISMCVVSGDAALRRAAESHAALVTLQTLDDVLAAASAGKSDAFEPVIDDLFADPGFDQQFVEAIEGDLDFVEFAYYGPLMNGQVRGVTLDEVLDIDGYDVAAFDGDSIGLILDANLLLDVDVRYLADEELRDKDDDVIPTMVDASVRSRASVKVYVSIDLRDGRFKEAELLTRELVVE